MVRHLLQQYRSECFILNDDSKQQDTPSYIPPAPQQPFVQNALEVHGYILVFNCVFICLETLRTSFSLWMETLPCQDTARKKRCTVKPPIQESASHCDECMFDDYITNIYGLNGKLKISAGVTDLATGQQGQSGNRYHPRPLPRQVPQMDTTHEGRPCHRISCLCCK
jgi:hypothetical protein